MQQKVDRGIKCGDRLRKAACPLVLTGTLLAFMLSACANVSRFERGSLTAFGEPLDGSCEPLYYLVRLDLETPADARTASSLLRFSPDTPPVSMGELTTELASRFLRPFTPPVQWPDSWKQKSTENEDYSGGGFYLRFSSGHLRFVGICSHCAGARETPVVGTPNGRNFYHLPLTEQQVSEVFGPPDRIYKVHEVRY